MKENNDGNDTNVGSIENSIEEDIKIVENYLANSAINEIDSNFFKNCGWETVDLEIPESMQHILLNYKRVLKENEELKALDLSNNKMIANMSTRHFHDREKIRNSIPKQKIKDKIKRIQEEGYWLFTTDRDSDKCVEILQELLGGNNE